MGFRLYQKNGSYFYDKSNEFLLCIFFDEEELSVFDFQDAWEEELKNLFPTSCKFKFEKDLIVFTIPEFE